MRRDKVLSGLVVVAALASGLCGAQAPEAAPAPGITITGSDITMPSNGTGKIPFTLTSVNGFVGTVGVLCAAPVPAAGVREPQCYVGTSMGYSLTANGTATGTTIIMATESLPAPNVGRLRLGTRGGEVSWALAGVLMLGFGLQRRRRRGYTSLLLAVGMLLGVTGLGACGGPTTLTPGTYTYTLTAKGTYGQMFHQVSASTTVTVTVPPGIVVQPGGPIPL